MRECVPICFFPTKVVLIDDDEAWLKSTLLGIGKQFQMEFLHNPNSALDFILKQKSSLSIVEISDIKNLMNDESRYNLLSIVISDLSMPQYTGLSLLNAIPKSIKKVLITSFMNSTVSDSDMEYDSIDGFIDKLSIQLFNKIEQNIIKFNFQFFVDQSQSFFLKFPKTAEILQSDAYVALIKKIMHEFSVHEFYLANLNGSFIMIDYLGNYYELFIESLEKLILYKKLLKKKFSSNSDVLSSYILFENFRKSSNSRAENLNSRQNFNIELDFENQNFVQSVQSAQSAQSLSFVHDRDFGDVEGDFADENLVSVISDFEENFEQQHSEREPNSKIMKYLNSCVLSGKISINEKDYVYNFSKGINIFNDFTEKTK